MALAIEPSPTSPRALPPLPESAVAATPAALCVALLTGGGDKPYALGLASTLAARGIAIDFIGSDELDLPAFRGLPGLRFHNLRGDQSSSASPASKIRRIVQYYVRLIWFALTSRAPVFHILWNNRFEFLDRTVLMLYYRLVGRRLVLTVHNINAGRRDGTDSFVNRFTLRIQYRLAHHLFVHTPKMKEELCSAFRIPPENVSVIALGVNNTVPNTGLSPADARARMGLGSEERVLLFFGRISPYKGLEFLLSALERLSNPDYRLLIIGSVQNFPEYWSGIQQRIQASGLGARIIQRIEFIPDEDTELYFKAADVLVLPYVHIFQSGVLVLAYSFGLPVIAADVGSLGKEVVAGTTGFVFRSRDSDHLAETITHYFSSPLYRDLSVHRDVIRAHVNRVYSWDPVGAASEQVYRSLQPDD